MQKLLFVIAILTGLSIAYIDSRPTWDDTAITVFSILLASAILGAVSPRRPWLWALAVGAWLPLVEIFFTHGYGSLVALVVAFAGAYAGMLMRQLVSPVHA